MANMPFDAPRPDIEAIFNAALDLHRQGRLADAESTYLRVLVVAPGHAHAIHSLGIIALQTEQFPKALEFLSAASRIADQDPVIHANLARALAQTGRHRDALASLDRALDLNPRFVGAMVARGELLLDLARAAEALVCFELAVQLNPKHDSALNGAGNALLDLGRPAESLPFFTRAASLMPDAPIFLLNRALAYSSLGRPADALQDCQRSRDLGHATAQLYFVEGNALLDLGRHGEAVAAFERALAMEPTMGKALNNLGTAFAALGKHDIALQSFERCLALMTGLCQSQLEREARLNRCTSLKELGRRTEALAGLEDLVRLAPDLDFAPGLLLHERLAQCDWHDYDSSVAAIEAAIHRGKPADGPLSFLAVSGSPAAQLRCARLYISKTVSAAPIAVPGARRTRGSRLRIGYLSSDFRDHAVAYLMAGVFELHDRSGFETYAFSIGADDGGDMRRRLRDGCDHFVDAAQMQDATLYARMAELGIDIAVDLNGHTSGARTQLMALRPAAVTVNYLGFPGTMGSEFIDYIIADEFVIPPESRQHFSERPVYLPDCFQANDDRRIIGAACSRVEAGLPASGFVFCAFNAAYKINPAMFEIWCRLLHAVPDSVLWLVKGSEAVGDNLVREARSRGIGAQRLVFAEHLPYARHLARLRHADLFLDTLPFNAGTTASDVLWAGVPVLTCAGEAFAARMAGSLLRAVGLPELLTHSLSAYEQLALDLAFEPARLTSLRARLDANRGTAPLFDTRRHCRHLEAAYREMWARYQRGDEPSAIWVRA
ncbi:MAG: tetratricopeptide repeat protein [Steroidobacteraceae bacterium]